MQEDESYEIFPLGDQALTVCWGNRLSDAANREVGKGVARFSQAPFPGMRELVPAYTSLTIYYDPLYIRQHLAPAKTAYSYVCEQVKRILNQPVQITTASSRLIRIPVCYDPQLVPDQEHLLTYTGVRTEELIQWHTERTYRVYMMGFLPGFAYMGEVDERIRMPRKKQPVPAAAGSVGIAGIQTGIYPLASPGGWNIIGLTPVRLFDKNRKDPCLLSAGDSVQFFPIDKYEFAHY